MIFLQMIAAIYTVKAFEWLFKSTFEEMEAYNKINEPSGAVRRKRQGKSRTKKEHHYHGL